MSPYCCVYDQLVKKRGAKKKYLLMVQVTTESSRCIVVSKPMTIMIGSSPLSSM